jgi:hypothetical protein
MITVAGQVILNPVTKMQAGGEKLLITGFTFVGDGDDINPHELVGNWLLDNFQKEFAVMGLRISKIVLPE